MSSSTAYSHILPTMLDVYKERYPDDYDVKILKSLEGLMNPKDEDVLRELEESLKSYKRNHTIEILLK